MNRHLLLHQKATLLRDAIFALDDGMVTTFAVVAGSAGASFGPEVIVILGLANIFADGFSMGTGMYLGVKSEQELEGKRGNVEGSPITHALVTYVSFIIAGILPLSPFLLNFQNKFFSSVAIMAAALFLTGILKGFYTKKPWLKSGIEMLFIGGLAAGFAYIVGYFLENIAL